MKNCFVYSPFFSWQNNVFEFNFVNVQQNHIYSPFHLSSITCCYCFARGPNSYLNISRVWVRCIACCFKSIAKHVKEGWKTGSNKISLSFLNSRSRSFFAIVIKAKPAFALALSVFFCYALVIHATSLTICVLSALNTFWIKLNDVDVTEFTYRRKQVPLSLLIHFFPM